MLTKPIFVFCCIMLLAFFLTTNSLFADVDTLKRIAKGESDVVYIGLRLTTFSSTSGARTMEEVVIHRSAEDSYRKVVSIVGAPKALAQENDKAKQQEEKDREVRSRRGREFRWERHRSQFSIREIELIAQNYALELRHWGEKIAGHQTDLLIIKPKHANRSTKYIYFARNNGVILRIEDLDAAGILRNMFVYNRISFDPKLVESKWKSIKEEIKPQPWHNLPKITVAEAVKILKREPIQPTYLPTGFQLAGVYKLQIRGNRPIRLKYTDGMLDFSIYQTTDEVRSDNNNRPNRGDRNREVPTIKIGQTSVRKHQRDLDNGFGWKSHGVNFFISGPLPHSELQKVVKSIILKKH